MSQDDFWVIDGHNDTMLALGSLQRRNFHERSDKGHIDFPV